MSENNEIIAYAKKYLEVFKKENLNEEDIDLSMMLEEGEKLGFKNNLFNSFILKYGVAVYDVEILADILDDVSDMKMLSSVLYKRLEYFDQWASKKDSIIDAKNKMWFIRVLTKLAYLSQYNWIKFEGEVRKIRLVSTHKEKAKDQEIIQEIIIHNNGQVQLRCQYYNYQDQDGEARNKKFEIDYSKATMLLNKIADCFRNGYYSNSDNSDDKWNLEITNKDDCIYLFSDGLGSEFDEDIDDLSKLLRNNLEIYDLLAFDGNQIDDFIVKISLEYHRKQKMELIDDLNGQPYHIMYEYNESLVIDRITQTIEHVLIIGSGCEITHKYRVEEGIDSLLNSIDYKNMFAYVEGNPDNVVETPNDSKDYTLTIVSMNQPQRIFKGSYDKNGLPSNFNIFIEMVYQFIGFYSQGEIFNPAYYNIRRRSENEYIYLSVVFQYGKNTYYYLCDDDSIEIGDYVLVYAGKDNHEAIVKVVNIEYFREDEVPLPLENTKLIIRKCNKEDLESL